MLPHVLHIRHDSHLHGWGPSLLKQVVNDIHVLATKLHDLLALFVVQLLEHSQACLDRAQFLPVTLADGVRLHEAGNQLLGQFRVLNVHRRILYWGPLVEGKARTLADRMALRFNLAALIFSLSVTFNCTISSFSFSVSKFSRNLVRISITLNSTGRCDSRNVRFLIKPRMAFVTCAFFTPIEPSLCSFPIPRFPFPVDKFIYQTWACVSCRPSD